VTTPPPADRPAAVSGQIPLQPGVTQPGVPQPGVPQPGVPQGGYTAPPPGYGPYPYPTPVPVQMPVGPSGHRLAEFSDRLYAKLIDSGILFVVGAVLAAPVYVIAIIWLIAKLPTETRVNGQVVGPEADPTVFILGVLGLTAFSLLLTFALNYIYEVEMMFRSGQTIGKRIMKIRVMPVDPSRALTRGMAFKRYAVVVATAFVPGLGWVDGLWQLWDKPWRQCLHDKFAQTLVIKLNP
jgi:uncharacterized RDD family membrane protein YckC